MARSIRAAGGRPGDVVHVAYGYGLFTGGLGAHYGAEALGCTVVPISGGMTERQVQLIGDFAPRVIMVTPSYFLSVLDEMERAGVDPAASLPGGRASSAPSRGPTRCAARSSSAPGMHAVDIYGLSEVMGPGVAQECVQTKDGLHIWEDHFYPEVVDPLTDEPVADGEMGELVFTSLSKQAMPVVRYRTRDLTRLLPGTARPGMRRMEKVTGRTDDMMIVRGVNVFPTQVEEVVLATAGLTPYFQCVLTRPGPAGRADRAGRGGGRRGHRRAAPRWPGTWVSRSRTGSASPRPSRSSSPAASSAASARPAASSTAARTDPPAVGARDGRDRRPAGRQPGICRLSSARSIRCRPCKPGQRVDLLVDLARLGPAVRAAHQVAEHEHHLVLGHHARARPGSTRGPARTG